MVLFNRPYISGKELQYILEAHASGVLAGDGQFTKRCNLWLEQTVGVQAAMLTHSCTAALEMAAILADIQPNDEIIMPSYTFVSTANAFVLRGGVPVFVDIRPDTLNLNENLIESAISPKTKAVVPVHYAGVGCEMATILDVARQHGLIVIEDAAQGLLSTYRGRELGGMGTFGTLSFHETKNVISGEGGALLVNDPKYVRRAEIIRDKGTNRARFFRGEIDKYTWEDLGSSFLPGEIVAAFLWAQLQDARAITEKRRVIWNYYYCAFETLENEGFVRRPHVPDDCGHNAHMFYLLLDPKMRRDVILEHLNERGIQTPFHYVPLHSSPAGTRFGRTSGAMDVTNKVSEQLIRLPMWIGMDQSKQDVVIDSVQSIIRHMSVR